MTKTRRQSKAAAAAASADAPTREPSPAPPVPSLPPHPHAAAFTLHVPEDIDFDVLATLLPDVDFEAPSPDAIVALYRLVVAQAAEGDHLQRALEETKAELQRKDVELDQALQDRESATRELETLSENVQSELRQVKQEKDHILASKVALEAQLSSLTNSQTATSTEAESLKHRIDDVEREKRDLVGVVSRLKEDAAQREEEIQTLRSNLKQARQEYQALESQLRELRSTETSTKFKLDSLTQQLQLAKDEAERTSADLLAKSDEFAKYRRAKHAELVQLQAAHDSLVQTHAATESTLKALQSSYASQSHQLSQALTRIQDLTGQLAEQEATYSSEAAGLRRLVEMMEEREAQSKAIVENIEKEWAGVGDRAERREVVLREEIEAQRQRAEEAENRVSELQKILDRLDRGEFPIPGAPRGSAPSTPARGFPSTPGNTSGDFLGMEGMMGLSPTVAMASRAQRGGKTFTEVYADYVKLQDEYARKCAEYDHMDQTLASVLAQIEERAPILAQQRQEYERMQAEASLLASQLSQALSERDASAASAEENGQRLAKTVRENELLNQQLNDLGRQIRVLLKELGRRQDPSLPSDEELDADTSIQPAENIEAVITNNLVLFKSIPELQEQNQKLLKIVRELGAKMEAEEKEYRDQLEAEQQIALQEAYAAVKELQDQLENQKKSSEITIQAYVKERDALKSMLARERGGASGAHTNGVNGHDEHMAVESDTTRELAEIRNQFETYKTEMGVDSSHLRQELTSARHEVGQANAQLAKANAKVDYLTDRQRMLQEQNAMQSKEIDNLTQRNRELYDQYTRMDIAANRAQEELLAATNIIDQLRNETANLRAEKNIWESVQMRLVEENRSLTMERSHLSDLMVNVQRMHHDLELSGENDRRRLEKQIEMLENQTQDLRAQLSQERDSARHAALQKELELKELRTRVDKINEDYTKTREALVAAETSKKHLEERVEQLNRQLRGNEEKLAVYERRAPGAPMPSTQSSDNLSREQQLETEVAELRSALKVAEVDLATARSHVQQFQEISQANEAALETLTATHDEYKASTEAQLAKREADINALTARLDSVLQELSGIQQKNAELQRTFEAERSAWLQDKKTLEGTIFELSTSERSSESDRASRQDEVRQLEERARSAEDRYGREVLAHAEAIKTVDTLRRQLSEAQSTVRTNVTAAETALAKLAASESSWKQQKDALEKEIAELKNRLKELNEQNNRLHDHLQDITAKATRIRETAEPSAGLADGEGADEEDTKYAELRSVLGYLRNAKNIAETQLEISKQESTRLRNQVEHLEKALRDAREALSEERERAVQAATSEAQHAELIEKINQLNVVRESNMTLRQECEALAARAKAFETKVQQLESELDPTKEQLRIARAELEATKQQMQRLEEESRRWQERNASLLSKYDRIDPAEVQQLKDQIDALNAAKASLEAAQASQVERIAQLEATNKKHIEVGKKNNEIMKRRIAGVEAEKTEQVSKLQADLASVTAERDALKSAAVPAADSSREQELNTRIESLEKDKAALEAQIAQLQATTEAAAASVPDAELAAKLAHAEQELEALRAEKANWVIASANPEAVQPMSDSEKAELIKARDEAAAQAKAALERIEHMAAQINSFRGTITKLNNELKETRAKTVAAEKAAAEARAALEAASAKQDDTEAAARLTEELRTLEERLKKQHQEELARAVEAAKSAAPVNADQQAALEAAVAARLKELEAKHEQEVEAAIERGRLESDKRAKLKDAQLVRVQNRLKDLEAQLAQLKPAGAQPAGAGAAATKPAANAAADPAQSSTAAAKPVAAKPAPANAAAAAAANAAAQHTAVPGLPPKPGSAPATGAGRGRGGAARGAARGGARGGAAGGLSIRGAAPAGSAAAAPAAAGPSDGVSIMGAAAKRPREDGEGSADDSLAKRLKPEGAATKPLIRRDRVSVPPSAPSS